MEKDLLLIKRSFKKGTMRKKDDSKKEALFYATQKIVIDEGFSSVSMSKIAKAANVAPATLYTYFENTDDLLDELFMMLQIKLMDSIHEDFSKFESYEIWFRKIWKNLYKYLVSHPDDFYFCQQFKTSPRMKHLCTKNNRTIQARELKDIIVRGQLAGKLKKLPKEAMHAFVFFPVVDLARMDLSGIIKITPKILQKLEDLAWDIIAIK